MHQRSDRAWRTTRWTTLALCGLLALFGTAVTGCGGAGGGAGPGGSGQGLILLSFLQDGLDNVALNTKLVFDFSEEVDPATITSASMQIREGGAFGFTVEGALVVDGARVIFEPTLPGLCDLSDAGFKASTDYRITLVGHPEEFSIRNTHGQPLSETVTRAFTTRVDTDPLLFTDQMPGAAPFVVSASPTDGSAAVVVEDGNRVVLTLSENLKPCTVDDGTVFFEIYQFGDKNTNVPVGLRTTGFATDVGSLTGDQTPLDPFTWTTPALQASVVDLPMPQKILAHIDLVQSFTSTQVIVTPAFGYDPNPLVNKSRFPENALVVLRLTFGVEDFGGSPLTPFTLSFTTENLPLQNHTYDLETRGETPWDSTRTTARVIEANPGVIQAFLLFSGDGDNGADLLTPTLPQSDAGTCLSDYQTNDGTADDFDPGSDVLLDTGNTINECPNATDGSYAVVWEFKSFRIRNGITVRVVGRNPAIILCQGDMVIDNGGRLLARGDNQGGAPRGDGVGNKTATTTASAPGGVGVAGGGDGGKGHGGNGSGSARYGGHGVQGYYHDTPSNVAADVGVPGGTGGGHGNTSCRWNAQTNPNNRNTPSGGGGGHAEAGTAGTALGTGSAPTSLDLPVDGAAGDLYGDTTGRMLTPEAGSGGGAGGELRPFTSNVGRGPGGAGGAGGGFVDLTSGGDIQILGTIDAAGGKGSTHPGGNFNPNYAWNPGVGGGGGGSGGGIRLLTPGDILFGATTVVTAAGGNGGAGGASQGSAVPLNNGGPGAIGRIAMEDSNSVITGLAGAAVTPGEGSVGFYRGIFDATRFKGGGTSPVGVTEIFAIGPFNPTFAPPTPAHFKAFAPTAASPGGGKTVMMIEVRGYQMLGDGTPDLTGVIALPTPWHTVGYFTDSGVESSPNWTVGQPPLADIGGSLPDGNTGVVGISNVDGCEYLEIRIHFFLKSTIGASDPGHYLDLWTIHMSSDQ